MFSAPYWIIQFSSFVGLGKIDSTKIMEVSGCMCTSRLSHGKDCPHRYCGGSASRGWRMAGQPAPGQQLRDGCGTFFGFVTVSASCEFCYYWLLKIHVQNSHSHRCEKINF